MSAKRQLFVIVVSLVVFSMIATACGGPQIQTVEVPGEEVIKTVVQTVEVPGEEVVKTVIVEVTPEPQEVVTIKVWSHFANENIFQAVINKVFDDYEATHPYVNIEVTWWDMPQLAESFQVVMSGGGVGAPDITALEKWHQDWICNGWLLDLEDDLPWDNYVEGVRSDGVCPGMEGVYEHNPWMLMDGFILYNPAIFEELGIEVPEDRRFTQDEFVEVVKTCSDAGYAGVANAIGNRPYTGQYPIRVALLNLVGAEEYNKYLTGKQSWDTPEVRQVLEWMLELREAGFWPDTLSTMGLDEMHTYFHTEHKACMMYLGSFYTSRAFKAVEEGGQSPDFRLGFLQSPEMDGAKGTGLMRGLFPTAFAVVANSEHADIAKDILAFWGGHSEYGARMALTAHYPSAIKWEPDDVPEELKTGDDPWQWYEDELQAAYSDVELVIEGTICGDFNEALTAALNEGIPLGLMTVDEAIEYLDASLCTE